MPWYDDVTFAAGEVVTAATLTKLVDNLDMLGPAGDPSQSTSYTPVWTAASVNPAIGNGTIVGSFRRVGGLVSVIVTITAGSSTTYGTGVYAVSMPVTPAAGSMIGALLYDSGSGDYYPGHCYLTTSTSRIYLAATTKTAMSPTVPVTMASGDILYLAGVYPAA